MPIQGDSGLFTPLPTWPYLLLFQCALSLWGITEIPASETAGPVLTISSLPHPLHQFCIATTYIFSVISLRFPPFALQLALFLACTGRMSVHSSFLLVLRTAASVISLLTTHHVFPVGVSCFPYHPVHHILPYSAVSPLVCSQFFCISVLLLLLGLLTYFFFE